MQRIAQNKRIWKRKVTSRRKQMEQVLSLKEIDDIDVQISLIQALIPVGLEAVNQKLQQEVAMLAGEKYCHGKQNVRWGKQGGLSVSFGPEGAADGAKGKE